MGWCVREMFAGRGLSHDKPTYDRALEHEGRRKIVRALAELGGVATFSQIAKKTEVFQIQLLTIIWACYCILIKL